MRLRTEIRLRLSTRLWGLWDSFRSLFPLNGDTVRALEIRAMREDIRYILSTEAGNTTLDARNAQLQEFRSNEAYALIFEFLPVIHEEESR
jgi:hypothetical protein